MIIIHTVNIVIFTSNRMVTIQSVNTRQTKRVSNKSQQSQEFKMDSRLNPNVPTFTPNQNNPMVALQTAMATADEDILNLKLLNFELQIEVNRKEEEMKRLREVINKLLTKFQDQPKYIWIKSILFTDLYIVVCKEVTEVVVCVFP